MRIISTVIDRVKALKYVFTIRAKQRYSSINSPLVRVVAETVRQVKRDDVTLMAAGVAYYAVLSLFPLALVLLGILRLFSDSETAQENLQNFFSTYLPDSVGFVDQIAGQDAAVSGLLSGIGFIALLWGATAMLSAMSRAINRANGIRLDRPFYRERPFDILLGIGIMFIFAGSVFGSAAIESVSRFDIPVIGRLAWVQVFARFLPFGVTLMTFALIYKVVPLTKTTWRNVWPAALLAAVLFELAKVVFLVYVNRSATFEIYGGMTLLVVLLVWSYFSAFVVLVGAELAAVRRQLNSDEIDIAA